jgi:cytochrome b involved in lipid metabolism
VEVVEDFSEDAPELISVESAVVSKPSRFLTRAEVSKHNKKKDCWIVIEGKVYDITNYVERHPGGDIILKSAGNDGTAFHRYYHPWVNIHLILQKSLVGILR